MINPTTIRIMSKIDKERKYRRRSKKDLVGDAGISYQHYQDALNGRGGIAVETLESLCQGVGLSLYAVPNNLRQAFDSNEEEG